VLSYFCTLVVSLAFFQHAWRHVLLLQVLYQLQFLPIFKHGRIEQFFIEDGLAFGIGDDFLSGERQALGDDVFLKILADDFPDGGVLCYLYFEFEVFVQFVFLFVVGHLVGRSEGG
jgi:hypothetical protein